MSPLATVRAVHFASCLMLLAIPAFSLWILPSGFFQSRTGAILLGRFRRVLLSASVLALFSAIVSFGLVTQNLMAETGADFLSLLLQTHFGQLFAWRLVPLGAMVATVGLSCPAKYQLPLGAAAVGSLAWAGHTAASGSPLAILADLAHLLASGIWPGELLPLILYLATAHQAGFTTELTSRVVRRFSGSSLIAVGLLSVSGLINACFLLPNLSTLWTSPYGRLLAAKVFLFFVMLALGATNLFVVIRNIPKDKPRAFFQIRQNVLIELVLGTAIILLVGALGLTAPPAP